VSKEGGLRVPQEQLAWDFVHQFSVASVVGILEKKGPVLLRLLIAVAIPAGGQRIMCLHPDYASSEGATSVPYFTYFS
jgi:hypothetical protein